MLRLTLKNGPVIFDWDGKRISPLLSAIEEIPNGLRANLILEGADNSVLMSKLKTFDVKAIDAFGFCLVGENWDEIKTIRSILDIPKENAKFLDGYFIKSIDSPNNSESYGIDWKDYTGIITKNSHNEWLWKVMQPTGECLLKGNSGEILDTFRDCLKSLQAL